MASLPVSIDKRLWKLPALDPRKAYSTYRASPTIVEVVEQGSKVLHREKADPKAPGDYLVEGQWLVHRTYPRAAAEHRKAEEQAAAEASLAAAEVAKAEAAPQFKAFIRELTRELGKPRRPKTLEHKMRAFPAPKDARCAELNQQARAAGGAATLYLAPWARELRVVAGRVGQLAELFLGPHRLEQAFDAIDRDAGLTLEYVATDRNQCALHVDRAPTQLATYGDELDRHIHYGDPVAAIVRDRRFAFGPPASSWRRRSKTIREPIVGPESDDW